MNQPDRLSADIYLTRNQLAALLAHHADVLAANLRTDETTGLPENRAGIKRAADLLDLHAEHLTAEKECTPVTELLDSILTFPTYREAWLTGAAQTEPAVQSPADRAAEEVAKHVTRAIFALKTPSPDGSTHYQSGWDDGLEAAMDAARDAVLAVLPEPVDRAAVRAEALGEGADAVAADRAATIPVHTAWARGMTRAEELLRRLAGEQPTNSKAPTDRAAIERAFAERLAAELTGCCTECDACIEIAQHLAGKDEPAAEERKQPPMDPVHILGIAADTPAPVAEQPAAADAEETRGGCGHGPERHGPEFGCVECRCPSTTGHA